MYNDNNSPEMNLVIACIKQWIVDYMRARKHYDRTKSDDSLIKIRYLEHQYQNSPILTWIDYDFVISQVNKKLIQEEFKNGIKKRKENRRKERN